MSENQSYTDLFAPFRDKESAAAFLQWLIAKYGFGRKTRYHLAIINKLIQNGTPIFKRTPQETLRGLSEGSRRHVEASFVARASNCSDREDQATVGPQEQRGLFLAWDEIERNLEGWARSEGCWYDDADKALERRFDTKIGQGSEANVYFAPPYVYKTIGSRFNPQEMLDRITITNFLFPETRLELTGLGRREDGEFCFIVRQPFIKGEYVEDKTVHLEVLEDFREDPDGIYAGFVNDNYILGDLHDRNILRSEEGNLYVIDCNVWLNTPEVGKGGKWSIPDVEYSEEAIARMNSVLDSLVPRKTNLEWFLDTFSRPGNGLREQLLETGRYDGTIPVRLKSGETIGILAQVDPADPDAILWIRSGNVRTLLPESLSLSPEEKETVCGGGTIVRSGQKLVFDLDRGRLAVWKPMARKKTVRKGRSIH